MAAAEILLSAPTQNTPKLALLPISGLGSGCACTQQSWILQQDGVMQDHVPWVQKGAIKGMHGGGVTQHKGCNLLALAVSRGDAWARDAAA